jgi:serine/threonine-protein kinase
MDAVPTAPTQPTIAVLPFANLGGDTCNDYFGDGLAEEILNGLTRLPGIRVIARASAFAYRGREHEVGVIAQKLNVTSVLHGSVRRSGNRIRVTANLIDVRDESQIWSERYDREMRDVFDIQDEIAQAIVDKLQVRLGARAGQPLVKRYTENPEAHSLYLRGNHLLYRLTLEDMEKGKAYLEQAVALEPGHSPAWVQLADYYIAGCFIGRAPPRSLWPLAKDAAARAVAADPEYADAQAAVGFVMALGEHRWADGMRYLDTALRLNPASARTHFWLAQVQLPLGRLEESLASAQRASALDPLFLLYRYGCGERFLDLRQYEAAANEARQVLDIDPNFSLCSIQLAHAYIGMGRYDDAISLLEAALESSNRRHYIIGVLGLAYVGAGRRGDAEQFLARLEDERRRGHVPASALALVAIGLGDHAAVLRWLDEAIDERDANLISLVAAPYFEPLRADPAYQALLRKSNLA